MKFEYKGKADQQAYSYELKETLTGQDFLDIRRSAHTEISMTDIQSYGQANLMKRLVNWSRDEEITDQSVLALGMDVYTILYNTAFRLETEEIGDANLFLAQSLSPSLQRELSSILENSKMAPLPGSGDSSNLEQPQSSGKNSNAKRKNSTPSRTTSTNP